MISRLNKSRTIISVHSFFKILRPEWMTVIVSVYPCPNVVVPSFIISRFHVEFFGITVDALFDGMLISQVKNRWKVERLDNSHIGKTMGYQI